MSCKKVEVLSKHQIKTKPSLTFYWRILFGLIIFSAGVFILSAGLNIIIAREAPSMVVRSSPQQQKQHDTIENANKLHMFGSSFMNLFDKVNKYAVLKEDEERSKRSLSRLKHNKYVLKVIKHQRELHNKRSKMEGSAVLHREISLQSMLQRLARQKRHIEPPRAADFQAQCSRDRQVFESLNTEYNVRCKKSANKASCIELYSKMRQIAEELNTKLQEMKVLLQKDGLMPSSSEEDKSKVAAEVNSTEVSRDIEKSIKPEKFKKSEQIVTTTSKVEDTMTSPETIPNKNYESAIVGARMDLVGLSRIEDNRTTIETPPTNMNQKNVTLNTQIQDPEWKSHIETTTDLEIVAENPTSTSTLAIQNTPTEMPDSSTSKDSTEQSLETTSFLFQSTTSQLLDADMDISGNGNDSDNANNSLENSFYQKQITTESVERITTLDPLPTITYSKSTPKSTKPSYNTTPTPINPIKAPKIKKFTTAATSEKSTTETPDSDENKVESDEDVSSAAQPKNPVFNPQFHESIQGEFPFGHKFFPDTVESPLPLQFQQRTKINNDFLLRNPDLMDNPVLEEPTLGQQHFGDNSQAIGASGPFMSLCDQISKKSTPQVKVTSPPHNGGFTNNPHFTSRAPSSFPVTGETMKASAQLMYNPNFGMMQMPTCFVPGAGMAPAPNMRIQGQQFFMQPMISMHNGAGMYPVNQGGYIYIPPSGPSLQSAMNVGQFLPVSGGGIMSPAAHHSTRNLMQSQPVLCSYMPGSGMIPGGSMMRGNVAQPILRSQSEEEATEVSKLSSDLENLDNIPSQSDIVYSIYIKQMYQLHNNTGRSASKNCPDGTIACVGTNECIPREKWCNSEVDCTDSSDETACTCKSRLSRDKICDGYPDCPMAEDELGCFGCDKFQFTCYENAEEFESAQKSTVSMCYNAHEKCDGAAQCFNRNDERDCSMIVGFLAHHLSYTTSYTEGILHRNYKGKWYPVCNHSMKWAREACEAEVGQLDSDPIISIIPGSIPGEFIQPKVSHHGLGDVEPPIITDSCPPSVQTQASVLTHVKCPPMKCGTRKVKDPSGSILKIRRSLAKRERKKLPEERVVGGMPSNPLQYPFIVGMYKDGRYHCGGIIYNENWIITAAHCLADFPNHYYEVRVGMLRRYSYSPMIQNLKVSHAIVHEGYKRQTMQNDLGLIRTAEPIRFNRWVRPICLPQKGRTSMDEEWMWGPRAGTICTAVGWGAIRESGSGPDQLRQVQIPILPHCKHRIDLEGDELCAGLIEGGRDACQGDSGGPLFCKSVTNPNELYLAGIVSHGMGCARADEPGVYTRVALYLDWIDQNVNTENRNLKSTKQICPGYKCVWGGELCIRKSSQCDRIVDCLGGEDEAECGLMSLQKALETTPGLVGQTDASTTPLNAASSDDLNEDNNSTTESMPSTSTTTAPPVILDRPVNDEPSKDSVKDDENGHDSEKIHLKKHIKKVFGKKFVCKNIPQTINEAHRCDRITDCEDGSDEDSCTCREYLRGALDDLICDGKVDCSDLTDEINCGNCTSAQFLCPLSRICIDQANRCDDSIDCPFKEDELDCFAITDGRTVFLDSAFRPSLQTSGFFTRNQKGNWRVVCDDEVDFAKLGAKTAGEVCSLLGFRGYEYFNTTTVAPVPSLKDAKELTLKHHRSRRYIHKHLMNHFAYANAMDTAEQVESRVKKEAAPFEPTATVENIAIPEVCTALFVECVPYASSKLPPASESDHSGQEPSSIVVSVTEVDKLVDLKLSQLPWTANIYTNGKLSCIGALLSSNWVAVPGGCVQNHRWTTDYIAAHFGSIKIGHHKPTRPFEQIRRIDCIENIDEVETGAVLVHLERPVRFNRHILPTFLPNKHTRMMSENENVEPEISIGTKDDSSSSSMKPKLECVATTLDRIGKAYVTVVREMPDDPKCKADASSVCFQKKKSTGPPHGCKTKDVNTTLQGLIACKEKDTGWYPRAFFTINASECDFKESLTVQTLEKSYKKIQQVLEHPYCRYPYSAPYCSTLRCPLGECLQDKQICNGKVDCHEDAIDEVPERCHARKGGCHASEMKCANGKCIPKQRFCDHINDCGDLSDEPSECSCLTYLKATDPQRICDGVRNCLDKKDEDPNICQCAEGSFKCSGSNHCVPLEFVCDLDIDCPNGEDEHYCYGLGQSMRAGTSSSDGFSEVRQQSFGVWHTKCFARSNPPNETDVKDICHRLGFDSMNTTAEVAPRFRLIGKRDSNDLAGVPDGGNNTMSMSSFGDYGQAMKAIIANRFSPLKLHDTLTLFMKPSRMFMQQIPWDKDDLEMCFRLEVKCT